VAVPVADGVVQFRNAGAVRASGLEAEIGGRVWRNLEAQTSVALQRSTNVLSAAPLANSPRLLYKARASSPLGKRLMASIGLQRVGQRCTRGGFVVAPYSKVDAALSTVKLHRN